MKKLVLKLCGIFILVFAMTFISLHLFSNNKQVKATETITTPSVEILKNNVSYSDSIYILYAVACEGFETNECEVSLLFWESSQESYLKGTEAYVSSARGKVTIDGKKCLTFYSKGLAAKNMTDDLIAIAYVVVDGVEYYSEPMKFSVLEYVYKMKDSGTLNPHQQRLLERMLSYGGAAQDNFGYNTDRKADSEYFLINLHGGHHHDGFDHGLYQKGDKIKIKAHKPEDGYKFSHWIDKDGNIIGDKEEIEIEVDKDQDFEAIYKPIETIILKDNLEIDEPFDATAQTLSLPDFVTINNASDEEETIEVSWDTTTFIPGQIGEQIIYGSLVNSDYVLENPLSIKVNIFPYTFTLDEETQTYAINKYYGTSEEETIPATFKELPVTTIKAYAFNEVTTLTNLVIPTTITSIEQGAIYLCDNITSITVPFVGKQLSNLNYAQGAFGYIFGASSYNDNQAYVPTNLKEVYVLDGITNISYSSFNNCISIRNITLPNTLVEIEGSAFKNCISLEKIVIPSKVNRIGYSSFSGCTSLVDIKFKSENIYIDGSTFAQCTNLQNVYFEGTIIDWCSYDFNGQEANPMYNASHFYMLNESREWYEVTEIVIPDEVTEIKSNQFIGFTNLTSITLPNTVALIKSCAFYNCVKLTKFNIPSNVSTIGDYAFYGCTALENITINSNRLTEIGQYAFASCPFVEIILPNTVVSIGNGAFKECSYLEHITIPEGVTNVGTETFYNCINLASIELPTIIYNIGDYAFAYCGELESIQLSNSLLSIGDWAFAYCGELKSIQLSNSLLSIGDWAFANCTKLSNIALPVSLESIGIYAFMECKAITSIVVPENITSLEGTFYYCDNLEEVTLPSQLLTIGNSVFRHCIKLTDITIPSTVKTIDALAFNDCVSLNNVVLPEGLETIGEFSFQGCESLTSIEIPSPVTKINNSVFSGCISLTNVVLPDTISSIGSEAFINVPIKEINLKNVENIGYRAFENTSLEQVTLGESLLTIGDRAFYYCGNLAIIYNLSDLELTIGSTEYGSVALNAKYIHNELPREIALEKEVAYGTTTDTLELPETVTFTYNEEEVTLDVAWDTTSFVEGEFGEQVIYGVFSDDELYDQYNILRGKIKLVVNVLPYEFELNEETNEYAITKYYGNSEEEVISETYNDLPVSSLNEKAFESITTLKRLTIPTTIKTIAQSAVYKCTNLEYIGIPFISGSSATNGYFGYMFGSKTLVPSSLVEVEIFEGITTIPSSAFSGCENIVTIHIPSSVNKMNSDAFLDCSSLKNVYYNGTIDSWCKIDFSNEDATPMCYGNHFFMKNLNNEWAEVTRIEVPSTITKINKFQFKGFSYVTEFILPSTLTYIGNNSFRNCTSITSIEIPVNVTNVTNHAFFNCTKLANVYFEKNISTIGDYAFLNCKKLTNVYYTGTSAEWSNVSIGLSNFESATINYNYVKVA